MNQRCLSYRQGIIWQPNCVQYLHSLLLSARQVLRSEDLPAHRIGRKTDRLIESVCYSDVHLDLGLLCHQLKIRFNQIKFIMSLLKLTQYLLASILRPVKHCINHTLVDGVINLF